jgi:micrococcal nuclease
MQFIDQGLLKNKPMRQRMKKRHVLSLIAVMLGSAQLCAADNWYGVKALEDGDTLVVMDNDQELRVQLLGIDAPEDMANPKLERDLQRTGLEAESLLKLGRQSTVHLQQLVGESEVKLQGDLNARDRYGRVPMIVLNKEGKSLNDAMLEDGYAMVAGRTSAAASDVQRWQQMEQSAVSAKRGFWGDDAAIRWRGK